MTGLPAQDFLQLQATAADLFRQAKDLKAWIDGGSALKHYKWEHPSFIFISHSCKSMICSDYSWDNQWVSPFVTNHLG
jgi:signal transduction histidine kinase